jgi:hypothetical protein
MTIWPPKRSIGVPGGGSSAFGLTPRGKYWIDPESLQSYYEDERRKKAEAEKAALTSQQHSGD